MFVRTKKRLNTLIDTLSSLIEVLCELDNWKDAVLDSLKVIEVILECVRGEEIQPVNSLEKAEELSEKLEDLARNAHGITRDQVGSVLGALEELKVLLNRELVIKLNVAFLPYKVSMWDSLETIYQTAANDKDCIAKVVPIPYYELENDKRVPRYEGDRFPADIPIVHYTSYNLEEEQPDVIFVHNIYDQYNTLTRVYDEFFTSNLKKFTDMLVYVPYCISSFIPPKKGGYSVAYTLPTIANVDKVAVVGHHIEKAAIRDGVPREKILVLGSPKLDRMARVLNEGPEYPREWDSVIKGRTVYLLDTGCLFFANSDPFEKVAMLTNILNITNIDENSALIWRPHPLTRAAVKRYTPYLLQYYDTLVKGIQGAENPLYPRVIFDQTNDYMSALGVADVLVSSNGSLLRAFLLTERRVIYLGGELPPHSLVPSNAFYYYRGNKESWYQVVKQFMNNQDPRAAHRKGLSARVYANTDGTSGETIYKTIKDLVLAGVSKF